ncbi:myb protein-related [Anaeramoeba flamelloides]|uniref:Myb protein-related n=1 Tax=Anaeramoeba flamelloides TaxID=1746091 RepID=A0AAV7Z4K0_9EUKA|nr:myb protein-related [Anaeramoeba flamelloides]
MYSFMWKNVLDPNINRNPFTEEEKKTLIEKQKIYGNSWKNISKYFAGRTENMIKNQWYCNKRKNERKKSKIFKNISNLRQNNITHHEGCKRVKTNKNKKNLIFPCLKLKNEMTVVNENDKFNVKKNPIIIQDKKMEELPKKKIEKIHPNQKKIKNFQSRRTEPPTKFTNINYYKKTTKYQENCIFVKNALKYHQETILFEDLNQEFNLQSNFPALEDLFTMAEDRQNNPLYQTSVLGMPIDTFHQIYTSQDYDEKNIDYFFQDYLSSNFD